MLLTLVNRLEAGFLPAFEANTELDFGNGARTKVANSTSSGTSVVSTSIAVIGTSVSIVSTSVSGIGTSVSVVGASVTVVSISGVSSDIANSSALVVDGLDVSEVL